MFSTDGLKVGSEVGDHCAGLRKGHDNASPPAHSVCAKPKQILGTPRSHGPASRFIGIWVVVVIGRVLVRSRRGSPPVSQRSCENPQARSRSVNGRSNARGPPHLHAHATPFTARTPRSSDARFENVRGRLPSPATQGHDDGVGAVQSPLSATTGSMLAARRAGPALAAATTTKSARSVAPNVSGWPGDTPKSMLAMTRESATAPHSSDDTTDRRQA